MLTWIEGDRFMLEMVLPESVYQPLGFAAGDQNLYRYVGNGPTNATDPSGQTLFVTAKDVDVWKEKFGDYVNLVPIRNGLYRIDILPKSRIKSSPFHNAVAEYFSSLKISGEGDVVAQALLILFDGNVPEPSAGYSHKSDSILAQPTEGGGRLGSYQLMGMSAYGLEKSDLSRLKEALVGISTTPLAQYEAAQIAEAIKNTFNSNRGIVFPKLRDERNKGYWCYEWAYAFEDAFKFQSSGKYFNAKVEASGVDDGSGRVHFWLSISSFETGISVYVDDGFMNGSYIHDRRPEGSGYCFTTGFSTVKPRAEASVPSAYDHNNRLIDWKYWFVDHDGVARHFAKIEQKRLQYERQKLIDARMPCLQAAFEYEFGSVHNLTPDQYLAIRNTRVPLGKLTSLRLDPNNRFYDYFLHLEAHPNGLFASYANGSYSTNLKLVEEYNQAIGPRPSRSANDPPQIVGVDTSLWTKADVERYRRFGSAIEVMSYQRVISGADAEKLLQLKPSEHKIGNELLNAFLTGLGKK